MKRLLALSLCVLFSSAIICQKKELTIEKAVMGYYEGLYPENLSGLSWIPNSEMYSTYNSDEILVFSNSGELKRKFTLEELNALAQVELNSFPRIKWQEDQNFSFLHEDKYYLINLFKNKLVKFMSLPENYENQDIHDNSGNMAYTHENNLLIWRKEKESRITKNEEETTSGQAIARYEFGISKGTFWSPNGEYLAFYEKDESSVTDYPLIDYNSTPASVSMIKYPMAGQTSEFGRVGVVDSSSGKRVYLESRDNKDSYMTNVGWSPDSKFIYVACLNREQTKMELNKYSRKGKWIKTVYKEEDAEYVEPENPAFFIPGSKTDFLWLTEKNGFNNLVLMNDEGVKKTLTNFSFDITSFDGFSENGKLAYFHATGDNPTENHGFILNLKSGDVKQLTSEPGTHRVLVSPKGKYFLDSYSSIKVPRKVTLTKVGKSKPKVLLESENPLKDYELSTPELFSKTTSDGTDLWCRMIKPSNFDESKKYPVLVYTYNGPHVQLVTNSWLGGAPLWMYSLAEEGYIIFTVDGRGSKNRGIDFEQTLHENMGTLEVNDQAEMAKWLKNEPYTDENRFAVHGWSYGGFMTTSLMLKHPGLFQVGVAGGPVIDWRLYEVMYTERYMDTPESNPEGYETADLKNYVTDLEGNLLLIHGTSDDVVVMQHSQEFLTTCIKKGVQIDFFPYPGHAHNVRGRDRVHLMNKVIDYIKLNLN